MRSRMDDFVLMYILLLETFELALISCMMASFDLCGLLRVYVSTFVTLWRACRDFCSRRADLFYVNARFHVLGAAAGMCRK